MKVEGDMDTARSHPGPLDHRVYPLTACVWFRKTGEEFGGLSNMAPGFPLLVGGILIGTTEAVYQALRFPHELDVQKMILEERSPMTAKMKSKPYRDRTRLDWEQVKVKVMRWALRVKLAQNWEKFGHLLESTGNLPIVESSRKDVFWGAKVDAERGALEGANVLGRLLMELREGLRKHPETLRVVEPPRIPDALLLGHPIERIFAPTSTEGGTASLPRQQAQLRLVS